MILSMCDELENTHNIILSEKIRISNDQSVHPNGVKMHLYAQDKRVWKKINQTRYSDYFGSGRADCIALQLFMLGCSFYMCFSVTRFYS